MNTSDLNTAVGNTDVFSKINKAIGATSEYQKEAQEEINKLALNGIDEVIKAVKERYVKEEKLALNLQQKKYKKLVDSGATEATISAKIAKDDELRKLKARAKEENWDKKKQKEALKKYDEEYKNWLKTLDKKEKAKIKSAEKVAAAESRAENAASMKKALTEKGLTLKERAAALKESTSVDGKFNLTKALSSATTMLADFATSLKNDINDIAANKSAIDTRLQGSKNETKLGSYWDRFSNDIVGIAGVSPLVKQQDVVSNLKTLVGQGISYNVEQRAFLETIKDKIATTFSATDSTLLRLVRIQEQDTTAARLGMESALTSFLNNMYETTEYMTQQAASIRSSLEEASALMTAKSATEFEYQVQKWMGSLYSVGFNNTSGLAGALGKLAAGDISSITEGGYGNLLVMAANKANLSVAEMLQEGLDDSDTNKLMQAMVEYLSEIYGETKNSRVVSQQMANVFGLTASDLKAAANLAKSSGNISSNNLNYGGMMQQLNNMAGTMYQRTSQGELMSNMFSNLKYTMAAGIANSPILYGLYNIATMLKDTTGGIDFSLPLVMGSGTAQTFNVADLMLSGALGGSILKGIGQMANSGSGGGFSAVKMLNALGVNNGLTTVSRGTGEGLLVTSSGTTTSESGYVGNGSSNDIINQTKTGATDEANSQTASAKEEASDITLTDVNSSVIDIYNLLQNVVENGSIKVTVGDQSAWTAAFAETRY